jgi:type IV pilus assembly protein PilN
MQITINLSSTPYLDVEPLERRLRIAAISLAVLTVCAASLVGVAHFKKNTVAAEELRLDRAIARASDELTADRKMLEAPESLSIASRALALNSLFDEKSFSWTMLMKQFEGVVPPEVQLATIQPVREKDGGISIRMHVIGPRDKVIVLIHGLELSRGFTSPHVTGETAHNDARPNQRALPLTDSSVEEFDIEAGYDEDATVAEPAGAAPIDRETASKAAATTSDSGKATPVQLTAAVVPVTTAKPGGTR